MAAQHVRGDPFPDGGGFPVPDVFQERPQRGLTEEMDQLKAQLAEKKRKFKQFKDTYPRVITPNEEFTKSKKDMESHFVPDVQKVAERETIGSAVVYRTSSIARDDRERVQLLVPAKGVISNKWTSYAAHNITVLDLTKEGQYIQSVDAAGVPVPYLRGVSSMITAVLPPDDKNWDDYLADIRFFNMANNQTRLKQALGQLICRASFNVRQVSLNQCFMMTQARFHPMNPATGDPRSVDAVARLACFYKKYIECDSAWEQSIPGGVEVYNGMAPSKENIEAFMKKYLAGPLIVNRMAKIQQQNAAGTEAFAGFGNLASNLQNDALFLPIVGSPYLLRAFQDLQLHEDTYEMIKHTMSSFYITLTSAIAEFYIQGKFWDRNRPENSIGVAGKYPEGLIMPQHLNMMMTDQLLGYADIPTSAEAISQLAQANHPLATALLGLKNAFRIPYGLDQRATRLYRDGTEWLNGITMNRNESCVNMNAAAAFGAGGIDVGFMYSERLAMRFFQRAGLQVDQVTNFNGIQFPMAINIDGSANLVQNLHDPNHLVPADLATGVLTRNHAIWTAMNAYIQPGLDPTGFGVFGAWNTGIGMVPKGRKLPSEMAISTQATNVRERNRNRSNRLNFFSVNRQIG